MDLVRPSYNNNYYYYIGHRRNAILQVFHRLIFGLMGRLHHFCDDVFLVCAHTRRVNTYDKYSKILGVSQRLKNDFEKLLLTSAYVHVFLRNISFWRVFAKCEEATVSRPAEKRNAQEIFHFKSRIIGFPGARFLPSAPRPENSAKLNEGDRTAAGW